MPFSKYSPKQKKLAMVAEPRDKITGADFKKLQKGKKKISMKNILKKVGKFGLGGPGAVAYELVADASPANVYTQKDLEYARRMQSFKNSKPLMKNKKK